jgi:Cof subfamily protein (haloacid dehalogenase superfamily)
MSDFRLIFLDLDGTIVGKNDFISPKTLQVLHLAEKKGCLPVLCTGRSRYTSRPITHLIGRGYGIYLNGTIVCDLSIPEPLRKITLPMQMSADIIRISHEYGMAPLCFAMDDDDRWVYTDTPCPAPPEYITRFPERMIIRENLANCLHAPPVSIETYGPAKETKQMTRKWKEAFGDSVVIYEWAQGEYGGSGAHIQSSHADKAQAAQMIADIVGVTPDQCLAIGDQVNDMELLQWAGMGVCMGDGDEQIRELANHVTSCFDEDGAAEAIERFVLA